MSILIISGSHQKKSQSDRIASLILSRLKSSGHSGEIFSLSGNPLGLWDEDVWDSKSEWFKKWKPHSDRLRSAEAFVIVSPEWGGMVPPGLKNLLLLASGGEMAHKPSMLVCISSGMGGSYPLAELRLSGYKNSKHCVLPEHILIRQVEQFCPSDTPANPDQEKLLKRLDFCLKTLVLYSDAFKSVREKISSEERSYPYGM